MPAAPFVATQAYFLFNTVAIHTWCESVTAGEKGAEVDVTTFGSGGNMTLLGGLISGQVTASVFLDYQAASAIQTIWAARNTIVAVEVRPTQAGRSATNPAFTGNILVSHFDPLNTKVGDSSKVSFSWPISGGLAMQIV